MVKDPEERRIELLKTARDLFYELGYEQTSVQKITETVGIAKGTFYHYFHSKEDILGQLADWQTEEVLTMIEHKVEKMGGNAVEKFRSLIENIISWKTENREMMITYIRVMFRDENFPLRNKLNQIYREKVYPLFSKVIRQGTEEGIFKVKDVEETSEIFLSMLLSWAERLAPITLSVFENPERISILIKKVKAFENAIERILGVKEGTLKIYDIKKIKKFFLEEG